MKRVKHKSKNNDKIYNPDINDFITSETFLSPIIREVESIISIKSHKISNHNHIKLWKIFLHICGRGILIGFL